MAKSFSEKKVEKVQQKTQDITVTKRERNIRLELVQLIMTIATIIFVALAFFARVIPYFKADLMITRAIQNINIPLFSELMRFISYIGFGPQINVIVGLIIFLIFITGLRWEAIVAILNAVTITIIGFTLKVLVHRPRPSDTLIHVFKHLGEYSFPSGHVVFYNSFFGYMFFMTFILLKRGLLRTVLLVIWALLVVLIGPSRVYLGAHWASDVVGAYLLGSIWLVVTIYFYNWGKKRFFLRQPTAPEKK